MPPSWPSRLLSGSSTPSSSSSTPTPSSARPADNPRPILPQASQSASYAGPQSPTRSDATPRQHAHNRSSSHPLPRIFSRKKSSGALHADSGLDVPPDDALIPVLNDSLRESPSRTASGKKRWDEGQATTRQCICCFTQCRFPAGLKVFRCTNCLTINDLETPGSDHRTGRAQREGQPRLEARSAYLLDSKGLSTIDDKQETYR